MDSVQLQPYTSYHYQGLSHLSLPKEQTHYTEMPVHSVECASGDPTRNPVTILIGDIPIGMFVLQSGPVVSEYTPHKNALLLIAYMIDYSHQGKGYANESLEKLPGYIREHFPEIEYIVLAVNVNNHAAQSVYKKNGFYEQGERLLGKKGWLMILEKKIEKMF
ncbi:GNAT family N-acetyltransferase [Halobacillus sp. K22]|uniref:GNAT family N-acetyltransferase n=1 Tax=Halobacillus sp. K22 TaxID=3457431 RepID=UPI003FCEA719